jgi:hypothetical protein
MIAATIALEGGYVNHPADPGGETNMGITKKVARQNGYVGPMRTLPREIAEGIYYDDYIVAPGYEPLIEIERARRRRTVRYDGEHGAKPSGALLSAVDQRTMRNVDRTRRTGWGGNRCGVRIMSEPARIGEYVRIHA